MPGYLDLAREALARMPPAPSSECEISEISEITPAPWDQAEAERLLAQVREALARVEGAVAGGKAPAARGAAMRTWLEVAEGLVSDREGEATRGWDALDLLRGAVRQALRAAVGEQPPPVAYTPAEEERLCRWLESYFGWPAESAALWNAGGR
jgi:hypothetical protein